MKAKLLAFASGLLFAVGLGVSGMTQPHKIVHFLDFTGQWDPSLALVMGVGLAVLFVTYRVAAKRPAPLFGSEFVLPKATSIDPRLLAGSALFGAGWGLAGYCPGPAVVAFAAAQHNALLFVPAMLGGMALFEGVQALRRRPGEQEAAVTACG